MFSFESFASSFVRVTRACCVLYFRFNAWLIHSSHSFFLFTLSRLPVSREYFDVLMCSFQLYTHNCTKHCNVAIIHFYVSFYSTMKLMEGLMSDSPFCLLCLCHRNDSNEPFTFLSAISVIFAHFICVGCLAFCNYCYFVILVASQTISYQLMNCMLHMLHYNMFFQ